MTIAGQTFVGFPYTKDTEEVSVYIGSLIGNIETHTHKNKKWGTYPKIYSKDPN